MIRHTPKSTHFPYTTLFRSFRLRVNGREEQVTCRGDAPLLYLLRNDLGLRGSRFGCGLAQCGACMVLLDGYPTPSCDLPVEADRKSTRLNSSHANISYAVFC